MTRTFRSATATPMPTASATPMAGTAESIPNDAHERHAEEHAEQQHPNREGDGVGSPPEQARRTGDEEHHGRRHQGDDESEGDDLPTSVVAGDEEGRVVPEEVEQRLRDGHPRQPHEHRGVGRGRAEHYGGSRRSRPAALHGPPWM